MCFGSLSYDQADTKSEAAVGSARRGILGLDLVLEEPATE